MTRGLKLRDEDDKPEANVLLCRMYAGSLARHLCKYLGGNNRCC